MSNSLKELAGYELDSSPLHAHEKRRVNLMNTTLNKARDLAAKETDPSNPVSVLIAEARVLILQMGKKEFAYEADLHPHAIMNAELPTSYPQHDSMSRIYRYLESRENDRSCTREEQILLEETREMMLELLVPELDQYGKPYRDTVAGLYTTWRYEVGTDMFEKASALTNGNRQPIKDGTLWQRREMGTVPDFEEVRIIARVLEKDEGEAAVIWAEEKLQQLLDRDIPEPVARLVVEMQIKIEGLKMNGASLRHKGKLKTDAADAILHGDMPHVSEVQAAILKAFTNKKERAAFVEEWKATYEHIASQPNFQTEFERIRDENGWTNQMISQLLGIKAPEERDKNYEANRTEQYRPSSELRRMYQGQELSTQAPAKAAIALISNDRDTAEYLENLFIENVKARFTRQGSSLKDSNVRHHRMLCGMDINDLAEVSGYTKHELQMVERGRVSLPTRDEQALIRIMHDHCHTQIDDAKTKLAELHEDPSSVAEASSHLANKLGGYAPLSRGMHTDDANMRSFNTSKAQLQAIASGKHVPPLPQLKHMLKAGDASLTPELLKDWYMKMAQHLKNDPDGQWNHPLARGFGMVVFEHANNLRQFWQQYLEDDIGHSILTRNVRQMNGEGYNIQWPTISRYLNAAGLGLSAPQRIWLQEIFKDDSDLRQAVESGNEKIVVRIIGKALKRWRKEMRSWNNDPNDCEHMLGLTDAERGIKPKKKLAR